MKTVYNLIIALCLLVIYFIFAFMIGIDYQKNKSRLIVHTNFENTGRNC